MNDDLMSRFKSGDAAAFDEIVKTYKTRLFRYLSRFLRDPDEAEDALQDLFLRLYTARGSYNPSGRLENFLYRIATNLAMDRLRKNRPVSGLDPERVASPDPAPHDQLDQKELMAGLQAAVSSLPENQKLVFNLVVFEDKSYDEVTKITGFSLSSIKSLLFRARTSLKKSVGPQLS